MRDTVGEAHPAKVLHTQDHTDALLRRTPCTPLNTAEAANPPGTVHVEKDRAEKKQQDGFLIKSQ